jgi:enamine deaminase RidA (YjgF/YER057c/UK114 family)
MPSSRDQALQRQIDDLGLDFGGPLRIGGDYVSVVRDGSVAYVSGQVPRVGETVRVTGRVGETTSLADARRGAQISAIRALLLLRDSFGSLDAIRQVLKVGVFVQCAASFTQQSEVADAASALLKSVLGDAGAHTRTSVGVYQLPKDASVEVDMVVGIEEARS